MCFPEDGSISLDLLNPNLRQFVESESPLADLKEGPMVISPGKAYFFSTGDTSKMEYFPDMKFDSVAWAPRFEWVAVLETDVSAEQDAHREILRRGFIRAREMYPGFDKSILFYEGDPAALGTMALGNAYRDHPPSPLATIPDYVLRLFDRLLGTIHHGMAAFVLESPDGPPRLQTPEETSRQIRSSVEEHLFEIGRLKGALKDLGLATRPPLIEEGQFLADYLKGIESAKLALQAGRLDEVEQWLKDNRQMAVYPIMSDVNFKMWDDEKVEASKSRYPRKKLLGYLLQRHIGVGEYFMTALELFNQAEVLLLDSENSHLAQQAFNEGVSYYKEGLRYLPEEMWEQTARGRGPIVAMGQLHREAVLHLVSDAVGAHCRNYSGDACVQSVSANYFGLEPFHREGDDLLLDQDGQERPQNKRAMEATADILLYGVLHTNPTLILDRFWPEKVIIPEPPDAGVPPLPGGVPDAGVNPSDGGN